MYYVEFNKLFPLATIAQFLRLQGDTLDYATPRILIKFILIGVFEVEESI